MTTSQQPDPDRAARRAARAAAEGFARQQAANSAGASPVVGRMPIHRRPGVCDEHGGYPERGIRLPSGAFRWTGCPECAAKLATARESILSQRAVAEADAARADRAARALLDRLGSAHIPARYAGASFGNFVADGEGPRAALAAARAYCSDWSEREARGDWLVMLGEPGTGKGHLAASIMREVAEHSSTQYVTVADLVAMLRSTWRRDSERSEVDMIRMLGHDIGLLVVDEVGVQSGTEAEANLLFAVLDHRYRNRRPTVLISNLGRKAFAAAVGDRVKSRLAEVAKIIIFDWPDYRRKAREAQGGW